MLLTRVCLWNELNIKDTSLIGLKQVIEFQNNLIFLFIHTFAIYLPSYKLIDNVTNKCIPKRCGFYYLESHIRIADDEEYKRKLQDYYNVKISKGIKQHYYNPHKKKF